MGSSLDGSRDGAGNGTPHNGTPHDTADSLSWRGIAPFHLAADLVPRSVGSLDCVLAELPRDGAAKVCEVLWRRKAWRLVGEACAHCPSECAAQVGAGERPPPVRRAASATTAAVAFGVVLQDQLPKAIRVHCVATARHEDAVGFAPLDKADATARGVERVMLKSFYHSDAKRGQLRCGCAVLLPRREAHESRQNANSPGSPRARLAWGTQRREHLLTTKPLFVPPFSAQALQQPPPRGNAVGHDSTIHRGAIRTQRLRVQ
mmetsp:Transcript_96575/g.273013  ORF Transcript_96575/g.273013 Transcript_96575/m.273013 type:complete len:261 (+) Transcript_96575:60-842(+)